MYSQFDIDSFCLRALICVLITQYAAKNGIIILDSYIDRAMTGTNDNRTDFQRMIRDSAKRAWDTILVYKLDRFSRNKYEMAIHRKTLRDNGVKLVSVKENIPDTPEGVILESMLEGMAEYYSLELAQKVRRGQKESRIKGNYAGGGIPYGYKIEKIDGQKKYVISEPEAAVVRRIFEEYASGKCGREIIESLTADGIYGRDGKKFGKTAIYGILQNERYVGIYRHKTDGVFLDTFPPIVSQHLFDTAQRILPNNKGKPAIEEPYLLRGKLRCGICGARVTSDAGTGANGIVVRYYVCTNRKKVHDKCKKATIRKDVLEKLIVDVTLKMMDNPKSLDRIVDKIMSIEESRATVDTTIALLYKEMAENQLALDNMLHAIERGVVSETTKARLDELEGRRDELKAKIRVEESKERIKLTRTDIYKFIYKAIRKEPIQMIRLLVKKIVLYDDKIEVFYNIPGQDRPDGQEAHQVFCFHEQCFTYESGAWQYTKKGGKTYEMMLRLFI